MRLGVNTFHTHPVGQRIILYGLPALVSDVVRGLVCESRAAVVVAEVAVDADLDTTVAETGADLVISTLEGDRLPAACAELIEERARVRVIALPDEAVRACVVELRPECTTLEKFTKESFIDALLEGSAR